ncbi:MAG: glycogen synthase GlgA [Wenzhouxiangella sp.]|nr:MAG: glycogen synthase GlgA [Wenzhouxiangella sp.]
MSSQAPLNVLIVASEIYPLAKTGGLADATAALASALAHLGVNSQLVMPGYESAQDQARRLVVTAELPPRAGIGEGRLLSGLMPDSDVPVHLVDVPELYRDGGGLYVHADGSDRLNNPQRFAVLSHAVCDLAMGRLGHAASDIVHANDWHTGLVPLLLQQQRRNHRPGSVFTVHNMAFQGLCPLDQLPGLDIHVEGEAYAGIEYFGQASFLKSGLVFADWLTTVSPRYAEEICTPAFGFGLDGVIAARGDRLSGILNGIDCSIWSPERSPWLPAHYSAGNLEGKARCKAEIQRELGLDMAPDAPLMIFIGRLTWQKMADVLLEALPRLLDAEPDRQIVVLGEGDRNLELGYRELAGQYPGRLAIDVGYSEARAHRLHGGGDILLHGSRFEPCGLTQLYAMHFGTIPIVRPVGGLADTVIDATPAHLADDTATGFYFDNADAPGLLEAVDRAIALYRQPARWQRLQRAAMASNFSWQASAEQYLALYRRLAETYLAD